MRAIVKPTMRYVWAALAIAVLIGLPSWREPAAARVTPGLADYKPVAGWPKLPDGWTLGEVTAVAIDKGGDVWVFNRGEHPLLKFKPDGRFVQSFAEGTVDRAHGLRIDADNNVWTTDVGAHTVIQRDPQGKVLRTLGEKGKAAEDASHFDKPANIAFARNGDFFVADGYGNSRVVKFDRNDKFIKAWGKKGTGAGEFNLVHAIVIDSKGLLYVGDRENNRIQIFDADGKFLKMWTHLGAPFGLFMTPDDQLYIADGRANKVSVVDLNGKVLGGFGSTGTGPGQFQLPHDLAVSAAKEIYVVEITNKRIQKFVPAGKE